jgi:hypothetical protein
MEEDPMQSGQRISLLFALLDIQSQGPTNIYVQQPPQAAATPSQSNSDKYRAEIDPGDQDKVLEGLYKAIGFIINEYYLPYNRSLSKGVGKALSIGIREEMMKSNPDKDIQRLFDFLKPVVTEAVEEIKQVKPY